jgi:hypothetical protein
MHSINHPKAESVVWLGKMLAIRMGCDHSVYEREIVIVDGLADIVWPVYPEIAAELGIESTGYFWRLGGDERIGGLAAYVEYAYSNYAKQGVRPDDLAINSDPARLDRVLGPQTGLVQ